MLLLQGRTSNRETDKAMVVINGRAGFRSYRTARIYELLAQGIQSREHTFLDGRKRAASLSSIANPTDRTGDLSVSVGIRCGGDVKNVKFLQRVFGTRGSLRNKHWWKDHGEGSAGNEESNPVHFRRCPRACVHAALEKRLLSKVYQIGALQKSTCLRDSAIT